MHRQQIGRLMLQANFGRMALERPALFLAHHYRLMVALMIGGLLLSHLLIIEAWPLIILTMLLYGIYTLVRLRLPARYEERFYRPKIQFWRAQLGIAAVTLLLGLLERSGQAGMLWVLYLPALLLISRYCTPQWPYVYPLVAIEVVALAVLARLFELGGQPLSAWQLAGEAGVRVFAVLLPSLLVHYLARVDIAAKHGAAVRDQVVQLLLEQTLFTSDRAALGRAICVACANAVDARSQAIYFFEQDQDQLYRLDDDRRAPPHEAALALQAARTRDIAEEPIERGALRMAAPIYGQSDRAGPVLAVVVLELGIANRYEQQAARRVLAELIDHIWPVCAYASIRMLLDASANRALYRLRLHDVLDVVLDALCNRMGFSFALISLVDEDTQTITTVRGKHVAAGWVTDSRHALSSSDILADVLRTGQIEVIDHWDARFDRAIWQRYNHEAMIRVWVPLGHVGVLEAGYYKCEKTEVARLLIELLRQYARDVTAAIENAQYYEREQHQAALMARLYEASCDLRVGQQPGETQTLLDRIAGSALELLGASIVLLYALNSRDGTFAPPIYAGTIIGRLPLSRPDEHGNIVRHIAHEREPYYQPDAQTDARLIGGEFVADPTTKHRTFTERQKIVSFAGVPLLAQGNLLGVLCVNYRERHQFSAYDRQVLELFAQQAAAIIASDALAREQERRRLEYDLHDTVKSSVRGMILFSRAASGTLIEAPEQAEVHLHQIRRIAWNILADVDMILKDLSPIGSDNQALHSYIRASIGRLAVGSAAKLVFEIDEQLPAFPMLVTRTLLQLIHEAVMNALEHAHAQTIRISLHCSGISVDLAITDDGRGFNLDTIAGGNHRGIAIMHERIAMVDGTLAIYSAPGQGTTVRGVLPLKESVYGFG
jgi:signal transduction histidine kinase